MPQDTAARFPTHVAIIVDGNRRWAKQRLMPVSLGHKAGFDRLREITRYAVGDRGVFVLSLYVFSTENFSRDAKEVGYLMDLYANNFRTIADERARLQGAVQRPPRGPAAACAGRHGLHDGSD